MVENNRKPIASLNMFPQFTTMNVIDGQAGIIIYSSLICYSLTIDNILNIIVLLILAGVAVATLTGDNGLLQKAQTAIEANEEATALEKIQVEVAGSYGLDGKIDTEQLNKNLSKINGLTYNGNSIDLTNISTQISTLPITVKLNNLPFSISENGNVNMLKWTYDNGRYKNVVTGQIINVGDTVKYETILNDNIVDSTKLLQLKTDLQNYSGDNSSTDNANITRDSLTWNFLDVKDGQIRLISSTPTTKKISLSNFNGYNNAVYLLDESCNTLYSSNKGKSKNLKIEDIEEKINKTNYDYTQYENTVVDTQKYGGTKEYTSNLKYPNLYKSEIGCKSVTGLDNSNNILGLSQQTSLTDGKTTATSKLKVTQTFWYKSMISTDFLYSQYYTLFINNNSNYSTYWLSSRSVNCYSELVSFAVSNINDGRIYACGMFNSQDNYHGGDTFAFRPVITLDSDVQLERDGTTANTWNIK